MRIITPAIYAALLGGAIYAAIAQNPLPNAVASAPPEGAKLAYAVPTDSKAPPVTRIGKREVCKQSVTAKHLGKHQVRDQMQLCVAQARVECLKQAIDQKLRGAARRVYVKSCVAA
jgi:anti-sigma28 factor (negative regulator of flagellin synthesis)